MKISVTGDQIAFFEQYGFILFEGVLARSHELFATIEPQYRPRDIWHQSSAFRQQLTSSCLPTLAALLTKSSALRYGFDYVGPIPNVYLGHGGDVASHLSIEPLAIAMVMTNTLHDASSRAPDVSGICIDDLPKAPGDVLCIKPSVLADIAHGDTQPFLLVGFVKELARFRSEPADPYGYLMKEYGYIPGEALQETSHPYVIRSFYGSRP